MALTQGKLLEAVPPLVVDLDGTLLRSDLLLETFLAYIRKTPTGVFSLIGWLAEGKAGLKEGLALATDLDVSVLPYDPQVLALIQAERLSGRTIVLATASHRLLAEGIAAHLGLFDRVYATEAGLNLSAKHKRDLLVKAFGEGGFDYLGNSSDDLAVWKSAREAVVVNPDAGVERRARQTARVTQVIDSNPPSLRLWLKALRLHQWAKNLLIFVPLLAAHLLGQPQQLLNGLFAFLCFGVCASSVYVLNDLLDLNDDRHHRTKRNRPFASGRLRIGHGLLAVPLLLTLAFGSAAMLLPWQFSAVLAAYYLLTLAYSLYLKRQMTVDVIVLAMLYTARIIAGVAAFSVPLTFWILAFSMFIFLSLALVKRYAELREARSRDVQAMTRGRGYYPGDLDMIASLGAASGYLAVMVLALYIHDGATASLYSLPHVIWLACPLLLFWITRVWMLTHRGQMNDDPVVFAIRDRVSQVIGVLFGLVFWIAA
ncbi:UbiA family prenyltransferase [Pseudomonas sp. RIT-PI-S]|uniref:UbiA family prenyltransferase n=1 Tax=Pseudomonas sp. RIT-PI-S TaxID=3035295 RepID=UPI0021D8FB8B|nr:UbiA family prenyltransferase [Pseudomonas sp. RIT-PI-S]